MSKFWPAIRGFLCGLFGILLCVVGLIACLLTGLLISKVRENPGAQIDWARSPVSLVEIIVGVAALPAGIALLWYAIKHMERARAEKGAPPARQVLGAIVAIGFVDYILIGFVAPQNHGKWPEWFQAAKPWWPMIFVAWISLVAVHEVGHAVAGWLTGHRLLIMKICGVTFTPTPKGVKFGFAPGGPNCVRMVASDSSHAVRKWFWSVFGGPAASVVMFLCLTLALNALHPGIWSAYGSFAGRSGWDIYLSLAWLLSVFILPMILAPARTLAYATDGYQILYLLISPTYRYATGALMRFGAQYNSGVRARDWDVSEIEILTRGDYLPEHQAGAAFLLECKNLDSGRFEEGLAGLRAMVERLGKAGAKSPQVKGGLLLIALLEARRGKLEAATEAFKKGAGAPVYTPSYRLAAMAAIAHLEGKSEEAAGHAAKAVKLLCETYNPEAATTQGEIDLVMSYATPWTPEGTQDHTLDSGR